jgi:hypothetical protein
MSSTDTTISIPPYPQTAFPPTFYDSPVTQLVPAFNATASDSLTAEITAGAPNLQVTSMEVCNWVEVRLPPDKGTILSVGGTETSGSTKVRSAPVASSNGRTPLTVQSKQYVQLFVTASISKGSTMAAGRFTSTVTVTGKSPTSAAQLTGTYLGTLIGKVTVRPATVVPPVRPRAGLRRPRGCARASRYVPSERKRLTHPRGSIAGSLNGLPVVRCRP